MPDSKPVRGKLGSTAGNALNNLLHQLGIYPHDRTPHSREVTPAPRLREEVAYLADLAHNGLKGGVNGNDVRRCWPQVTAMLKAIQAGTCGARHPTRPELRCTQDIDSHRGWHSTPGPSDPEPGGRTSEWAWPLDAVRADQLRDAAAALAEPTDRLNARAVSCDAVLWHGPGHQSKARCQVTGPHEIHETVYGVDQQFATWRGAEAITGLFDEPPEAED